MKRFVLALALICLSVHRVVAFSPPVDQSGTLKMRIDGVPAEIALDQPLRFTVVLEQTGDTPIQGVLSVFLNDDWTVTGDTLVPVDLAGRGTFEKTFEAVAKDRALAAHYPVHAQADLVNGDTPVTLHPIAVFQTSRPQAPGAPSVGDTKPALDSYSCLQAPDDIWVDGDLKEWENAVPVFLGPDQCSTGTITPESFGAVFRALHRDGKLFVALRVNDDDVSCTDFRTPDFMNSDYIRLYLSATPPTQETTAYLSKEDVVLAISVLGNGDSPAVKIPSYGFATRRDVQLDACRFACRRTANGYAFEAAIPLSVTGKQPSTNAILGFNLLVGDADAGHRVGEVSLGHRVPEYWLRPASFVPLTLSSETSAGALSATELPLMTLSPRSWALERFMNGRASIVYGDETVQMPVGWSGTHKRSGTSWHATRVNRGGQELAAINFHPPFRKGSGAVSCEFRLQLPDVTPIALEFKTAIRDNTAEEPPSDGVEFRVLAKSPEQAETQQIFQRFTATKTWEAASASLDSFAGKEITLTLWNSSGPEGNTTCDSGYWGAPTLVVGPKAEPIPEAAWEARINQAELWAREAAGGKSVADTLLLGGPNGAYGVALLPGKRGLVDAVLAFSGGKRTLSFRGFEIDIDGRTAGDVRSEITVTDAKATFRPGSIRIEHTFDTPHGRVPVRADLRVVRGALSVAFSMPGVTRNARGEPRFTRLGLGPSSAPIHRVYAGFGNVIESPGAFKLRGGGFQLSTRHVGADYADSLSLLQASDIYPDALVCRPESNLFQLQTHHDARFLLIPSATGAFTAARHYRDLNGFKPGKGIKRLFGRMCLDQWGGEYGIATQAIERAAAFGLTHSVFVKHVWQRWGYDYRLPEIYPPRYGLESFKELAAACRKNGILFAPHDNYIDFYPDAAGFSYDHIIFNRDGTPQKAWLNKGRNARSYRWLPHAFMPWLKENMKLMKTGFAPTSLFIDVFSAIHPMDYYDRTGAFHMKTRALKEWAKAFDVSRAVLARGAPMLSEAGHDGLVGSLDGGQADHNSAAKWGIKGAAATRTPWHDMATHGRFVLLAGGLGSRYGDRDPAHTYGTDDYLSNTVIGGRNPMCDGPFSRRAVMTYWLLHDVCNTLAHLEFEAHEFANDTVYRQHTLFSRNSGVWTNRTDGNWFVHGFNLPKYGFLVRTHQGEAGVVEIQGQRVGFARSPDTIFVDARPPYLSGRKRHVATRVLAGRYLDNGVFEIDVEWEAKKDLEAGLRPFVHVGHPKADNQGEGIAHHGHMNLPEDALTSAGTYAATIRVEIPPTSFGGEYTLRYGLYNPGKGGYRVRPDADVEGDRVRGGKLLLTIEDGQINHGEYVREKRLEGIIGLNREQRPVDFGPVVTNGAFRLLMDEDEWTLIPLPNSMPFQTQCRLAQLGAPADATATLTAIDMDGKPTQELEATVSRGVLSMALDAEDFAYKIRLVKPKKRK